MNVRLLIVGGIVFALGALGLANVARASEETVSLDQTPALVKAAIVKEVEDGKINKIEKDEYDGKTVYEVEYTDDGKNEEAAFTEDGKSVGEDKDEDKDDDGKGDNEGADDDGDDKK